ncbi:MAG: hypothetical protein KDE27_02580 [Planctomycetes bacterium]|nr:hypothetical protein [Planctomycetota bacterium]
MLHTVVNGAFVGCLVAAILGFAQVRVANNLETKLAVLRRILMVYGVGFAVAGVLVAMYGGDAPRLPHRDLDASAITAYLAALRDHESERALVLPAFLIVGAAVLPAVAHVLRELASFVLAHRLDLLARDQAAVHGEADR